MYVGGTFMTNCSVCLTYNNAATVASGQLARFHSTCVRAAACMGPLSHLCCCISRV